MFYELERSELFSHSECKAKNTKTKVYGARPYSAKGRNIFIAFFAKICALLAKNLTNRDCRVYVSHLKTVFQAEEGDIVEKCYSYAV